MIPEEFLRLLRENEAFREEIRRQVLTDDLLQLPGRVERLREEIREEFRRVWEVIRENSRQITTLARHLRQLAEQVQHLTERMERVEAQIQENSRQIAENSRQIAALTERMERVEAQIQENSRQIAALTERMERVEAQIAETSRQIARLAEEVQELRRSFGRMQDLLGGTIEEIAAAEIAGILRRQGLEVSPMGSLTFDGEIDLIFWVRPPDRTLIVECKHRVVQPGAFRALSRRLRDPALWRELQRRGLPLRLEAYLFGLVRGIDVVDAAQESGVGLWTTSEGIIVPAVPVDLEGP